MWAIHHRFFRRGTQAVRLGVLDLGKDLCPSTRPLGWPGRAGTRLHSEDPSNAWSESQADCGSLALLSVPLGRPMV